jgi:ribosome maturation factor RimP
MNTIEQKISDLIDSVLSDSRFFLVDIKIKGVSPPEIWVYVDGSERSVTMDECAEISDELGFLMEAHEIFSDSYRLNVSSPGMKQALVDKRQYPKNRGRKIKVKFKNADGYHKREGILEDFTDNELLIKPSNEDPFYVYFNQIVEAKVVPSLK